VSLDRAAPAPHLGLIDPVRTLDAPSQWLSERISADDVT
jgi:hypothetical protein